MTALIAGQLTKLRNRSLFAIDVLLVLVTPWLAFYIRTESIAEMRLYQNSLVTFAVLNLVMKLGIFYWTGLYTQYWRYASVDELIALLRATAYALVGEILLFFAFMTPANILLAGFPRSLPLLDAILSGLLVAALRLSIRLTQTLHLRRSHDTPKRSALIVGAGVAGAMTVKELQMNSHLGIKPVGYIDDDKEKQGTQIHGVRVLGAIKDLPTLIKELGIFEVIIAMPTAPGKVVREVVQMCKTAGVASKTIPGIFEILRGTAKVDLIRDVQLEDLLRRGTVKTDTAKVVALLNGGRVMVTGAGGSIGSELCRQIRGFGPSELILVGHGENSIFQIAEELNETPRRDLVIHNVIADIRDRERMETVFRTYKPQIVFHAAAHKHVPLMEANIS